MSTSGRAELEGSAAAGQAATVSSLEQVREILFGPHHRELARRLARMDAHTAAQAEELRAETRRRLEALEQHLKNESEALTALMESQRVAQLEALGSSAREARETASLLEQRVGRLEEQLTRTQRDLRQQLLDQAKSFIDEARRMRDEIGAVMERQLAEGAANEGEPALEEHWEKPKSSEAA
jgi:hypothetical protein